MCYVGMDCVCKGCVGKDSVELSSNRTSCMRSPDYEISFVAAGRSCSSIFLCLVADRANRPTYSFLSLLLTPASGCSTGVWRVDPLDGAAAAGLNPLLINSLSKYHVMNTKHQLFFTRILRVQRFASGNHPSPEIGIPDHLDLPNPQQFELQLLESCHTCPGLRKVRTCAVYTILYSLARMLGGKASL